MLATVEPNVVWRPLPGSSQEAALDTRCHHTLFTGTRGPGKTDTQLMRFRRRVGIGYKDFWRGIIFDREYKHLDDLIAKSKRWFNKFNDGAQFLSSTSQLKWVWPTGEELLFRVIKTVDDYENYHGQEYPFIGWNELTKYPTPVLYDMMMSCNRSSFTPEKDGKFTIDGDIYEATGRVVMVDAKHKRATQYIMPYIPLEVFSTTNSIGPGHNWVKARFIDVAPYGRIVRRKFTVFNPRTQQEEEIERTQVTIFGSYKENIYLDPAYIAGLSADSDENRRRSWLEGDWDVVAGGALDDVWKPNVHILPRFAIPEDWYIDRTFDWGSSHPFSVGFWAEANGEEVVLDQCVHCKLNQLNHILKPDCVFTPRIFCPPRGSLIRFAEWYGTKELGSNQGVKMPAGVVAEGIREREIELMSKGWIPKQPSPGPADNQIRDVREDDVDTIEKKMSDKGIRWTTSDKSSGSRRIGLELLRERFINAITLKGPAIYFMENCRAAISTLPILPRDEKNIDDVDSDAEDHPYDEVRYRVLKGNNRLATKVPVSWPN